MDKKDISLIRVASNRFIWPVVFILVVVVKACWLFFFEKELLSVTDLFDMFICYISLRKKKPVILGLWIYFHPVMGFWYKSKTPKKINRTSSDLIDKIIQNRHRKEGWGRIEEGWRVFSSFSPLPGFLIYCQLGL